jgi:hypothetical protein
MTKNWKKFTSEEIFFYFLIKNCNLLILKPSIEDVQATGEAFRPQYRTSSTSKHKNVSIFVSHFCPSDLIEYGSETLVSFAFVEFISIQIIILFCD